MTTSAAPSTSDHDIVKKRTRLRPEIRRQQILDAALVEFTALGYTAASIARIARRVGTSKANIYVYFSSKDEIFETLLQELLVPMPLFALPMQPGPDLHATIDQYLDDIYGRLTPQISAAVRLLIAESHRVPNLIRKWFADVILPARNTQQQYIDAYVADGKIRRTPLSDDFHLIMAPMLMVLTTQIVLGTDAAQQESRCIQDAHRKLLHLLLEPAGNPPYQPTT